MVKDAYAHLNKGKEIYDSRTDIDIIRNRQGNFELVFRDKNGEAVKDIKADIKLENIDFNFGANIFMLGEYDEEWKNKKYEEYFLNLFNSATVPLYWEGTEPEMDYLRYDKGSKRDVYRRPPVDEVVEFCKKNKLRMKGHPLFWHEIVPAWLPHDYKELKPYIEKRFAEIAEHCKNYMECFDVVNEPTRVYDCYLRDRGTGRPYILPDKDYCVWLFDLANKYFPANKLILNDTVEASFVEFRREYSAYYLNIKDLLGRGVRIDEIGFQCHCWENGPRNVYNAECLYDVLDTYASFGKTINISEIGIPSKFSDEIDEELQAELAKQLYKVCFSHENVTGITWWNLPDDGVLISKRVAGHENLPTVGLIDAKYEPKLAYKVLDELINKEWTTDVTAGTTEGIIKFRGFYGEYKLNIQYNGKSIEKTIKLNKNTSRIREIFI